MYHPESTHESPTRILLGFLSVLRGLTDLVPGLVGLVVSGMLVQPAPLRLQSRITNLRVRYASGLTSV